VFSNPGIRSVPSTALSMLIAGVITPSPTRRDIPMKERNVTKTVFFRDLKKEVSNSFRTMVPPSPFCPRPMASHAYSMVTSIVRVQKMRERTPIMFCSVGFVRRKTTVNV